jgi:hypothetical protein
VTRSAADNKVLDASLLEMEVDPCVNLQPDDACLYVLNYRPFPFSNDVLHWSVNASGLLENVSSTTEDRISQIVTELGSKNISPLEALKEAAAPSAPAPSPRDASVYVETQEQKNAFLILPGELRSGNFSRTWMIHADGPADKSVRVDASFAGRVSDGTAPQGGQGTAPQSGQGTPQAGGPTATNNRDPAPPAHVRGLLTRPLRPRVIDLVASHGDRHLLSVSVLVPDETRWMTVPVLRYPFVKNTYVPKFSGGVLVENAIDKPSEVEGFLSIPVNVLKSIFSIPAQLFSFTVTHRRRER